MPKVSFKLVLLFVIFVTEAYHGLSFSRIPITNTNEKVTSCVTVDDCFHSLHNIKCDASSVTCLDNYCGCKQKTKEPGHAFSSIPLSKAGVVDSQCRSSDDCLYYIPSCHGSPPKCDDGICTC
ncbi:uncharacterized protein LOC109810265 [Cajanus cajan]|uniref:uncharacterized protein LOC109810265 n=1 Tax=Cajanus cajan TaxID=3821 RepID=UPI00098D84E1|nr:uncharacterized protein LOC109810265 [Cajanus cajan]